MTDYTTTDHYNHFNVFSWQPMDTAPKDGRIVLGYDPKATKLKHKLMYFHQTRDGGFWRNSAASGTVMPTHWMPLPEPPKEKPNG